MSNRAMAVSFFFMGTLFFCTRYLAAAILVSSSASSSRSLFEQGLSYVGPSLLWLSIGAFLVGIICLIWNFVTNPK